jgi:pimeloyl-ACP methyl ester carboxylesterase
MGRTTRLGTLLLWLTVPSCRRIGALTLAARRVGSFGSVASKEMVDYWDNMFKTAPEISTKGLLTAVSKLDLGRDGVLQRIKAPTLVMTADRSKTQSVETVRQYQMLIPNSRLVVLRSDAYHIAAANADECVTNVLAFFKEAKHRG